MISQFFVETDKRLAETNQRMTDFFLETEKRREEEAKHREAEEARYREEEAKRREESEKQLAALRAESEKYRAEADRLHAENERYLKKASREWNKKISDLGNVLGLYAEAHVRERIVKLFADRGIHVPAVTYHYTEKDEQGNFRYEIDILLYDSEFVVIVEVKSQLKVTDVDYHIERMEKCQQHPPRGANDKRLLGCVAGMIVGPEVEAYAIQKGFFVIKPSGKSVTMTNEPGFKPREW